MTGRRTARRIRVLESIGAFGPTTNPYVVLLIEALRERPDVEVLQFSFRRAILGRYQVLHVHWPEAFVGGHRWSGHLARRTLATLMVLRIALTRIPIVRTWHNVERPAGLSRWDHWVLDALDRRTVAVIRLNPVTEVPLPAAVTTIPHGHYRDWYAEHRVPIERHPRQLLYFGLIRPYKGVEDLLDVVVGAPDLDVDLRLVGAPADRALADRVRSTATQDARITCELAYVADARLAREIGSTTLVVLPYRDLHNSGAVLLALSLDTPVLVPDNAITRALAAETGSGWVQTYRGELTSVDLEVALDRLTQEPPQGRPNLDQRGWDEAARAHAAVFLRAHRGDVVPEVPTLVAP